MSEDHERQSPAKRRRISRPQDDLGVDVDAPFSDPFRIGQQQHANHLDASEDACETEGQGSISISATDAVAPFLARHIPDQYAPMGRMDERGKAKEKDPNTKFCYRHRPDLKCRRKANEPSMDQLQQELQDLSQGDQQAITHAWSVFSAAPAKQRNLMLQGILAQCCFSQLSYLSANVRELVRIDFLTALPTEMSFKILCYLDTTSLCKAAQVSQRWRSLADDDVVWHRMCEQHIDRKCEKCGWGLPLLERKLLRSRKREIQLRATGRGLNEWSPNITPAPESVPESHIHDFASTQGPFINNGNGSLTNLEVPTSKNKAASPQADQSESYFLPRIRPWKDVYKDRYLIGSNWKYGRCNTKIFKGHSNGVMCLQFDDNILATGSYDSTIKIWDIETGEEIRTLRGHTSGVRCLQFDGTKLISGSLDHTVRIWNWRTGDLLKTHTGHTAGIIGLHFDGTLLASGSKDTTIKIWDFGTNKSTYFLHGHTDFVNAVRVDSASRTVFSASDDCTVKLWDLDTKTCIKTFEGHVGHVQQVVPLPPEFIFDEDEGGDEGSHSPSSPASSSSVGNNLSAHLLSAAVATASTNSNGDPLVHDSHPEQTTTTTLITEPYGPGFTTCDRPMPPRYMLTGALDSTIRLWDTYTSRCLRTYFGHVEGIWALAADTLRIVSGAQDRMVKVWDMRSDKCNKTFTGHAGPVTCIGLSDSRMCTGGEDAEVRMYSF